MGYITDWFIWEPYEGSLTNGAENQREVQLQGRTTQEL
jgi:hypothetical protein